MKTFKEYVELRETKTNLLQQGKGWLGGLVKSAGKFAIDKGADFAKGKIEGLGMRKKRRATPAQLEALARGRAIRDANRRGGALYAAGY